MGSSDFGSKIDFRFRLARWPRLLSNPRLFSVHLALIFSEDSDFDSDCFSQKWILQMYTVFSLLQEAGFSISL